MRLNHTIWCICYTRHDYAFISFFHKITTECMPILLTLSSPPTFPLTRSHYYLILNTLAIVHYKNLYEPSLAVDDSFNLAQINFHSILAQKSKRQVFIVSRGMFVYHLSRTRISSLTSGINLSWNQWKSPVGLGHANHLSFHPALLNCI